MASNPQSGDHIVRSYDEELAQLNSTMERLLARARLIGNP